MKKSVIVFGPQGSGKTQKAKEMFLKLGSSNVEILDELSTILQLENLVESEQFKSSIFIVCSQLKSKDVPQLILSNFDVFDLGVTY